MLPFGVMANPRAVVALLLWMLPGFAADSLGQGTEIAGFGGLAFGGALVDPVTLAGVDVDAGFLFGAAVSGPVSVSWRIEALFSNEETRTAGPQPGTRIGVSVQRFLGGIQEEAPWGHTRAFGTFLIGATRFAPDGASAQTWFTLGLGLGVKMPLAPRVGLRIEAHVYYTPITVSGTAACGGGTCLVNYTGSGMFQGDLNAGLFVRF